MKRNANSASVDPKTAGSKIPRKPQRVGAKRGRMKTRKKKKTRKWKAQPTTNRRLQHTKFHLYRRARALLIYRNLPKFLQPQQPTAGRDRNRQQGETANDSRERPQQQQGETATTAGRDRNDSRKRPQ